MFKMMTLWPASDYVLLQPFRPLVSGEAATDALLLDALF